jgi:ABC-type sulfate/molybdate transport systems ATPase subunit
VSTLLRAVDLRVERRSRASRFELHMADLELRAGSVLAILGPNGAGKTTLLRALAGLEPPLSGRVERAAQGPVTMVFQRPIAFVGSVGHNVRVALWGTALSASEREERVADALARFGIGELAERSATRLSGGELRRLALARAFALAPGVLLLDEPFEDLDAGAREALSRDLRRAIEATGVAVALVTHDLRRATLLADRIAVLEGGRLHQVGTRDDVLLHPASATVARLVGMSNLIAGELRGEWIAVDGEHRIPAPPGASPGGPVLAGLRPEHVKLDIGRGEGIPIGKGVVRQRSSDGVLTTLVLEWGGHEITTHLVSGRGLARTLAEGDGVLISVRSEDVHVLPRDSGG